MLPFKLGNSFMRRWMTIWSKVNLYSAITTATCHGVKTLNPLKRKKASNEAEWRLLMYIWHGPTLKMIDIEDVFLYTYWRSDLCNFVCEHTPRIHTIGAFVRCANSGPIRRLLTLDAARTLVCRFVMSRIDYCNSLLADLPAHSIARLQSSWMQALESSISDESLTT